MTISIHGKESIRETLAKAGVSFDCGGNGVCGKCRIRVMSGWVPITEADRAFFSEKELEEGWRLACRIEEDSVNETGLVIETCTSASVKNGPTENAADTDSITDSVRDYSFAIDIGTTTIGIAAVDPVSKRVFDTFTCMNSQRMYGADVVSRIVASNNGLGPRLKSMVIEDINHGIETIMNRNALKVEGLDRIVIAANTVMEHIFAGLSCEGLGVAPFSPVTLDEIKTDSGLLLPGISAFVGADVLAGMSCIEEFAESGKPVLFIDLGTNGEMALGNSEKILVTSTAAGPAFEGGNLSSGCAGVEGAICDVELSDDDREEPIRFKLIGRDDLVSSKECEPAGICGSGVIALMAELLCEGIVDKTGLIDERLSGKISLGRRIKFTQKDIRELQLAKAAVSAGIETLMYEYGVSCEDIGCVYLAGSFGKAVDVKKAAAIGLIPGELGGKCVAAGNTSLEGAVRYISDDAFAHRMEQIKAVSSEIVLADNTFFADRFINRMNF